MVFLYTTNAQRQPINACLCFGAAVGNNKKHFATFLWANRCAASYSRATFMTIQGEISMWWRVNLTSDLEKAVRKTKSLASNSLQISINVPRGAARWPCARKYIMWEGREVQEKPTLFCHAWATIKTVISKDDSLCLALLSLVCHPLHAIKSIKLALIDICRMKAASLSRKISDLTVEFRPLLWRQVWGTCPSIKARGVSEKKQ